MNRALQRTAGDLPGNDDELIQALKYRYIGDIQTEECAVTYAGIENKELHSPVTAEEVYVAARAANCNSAPGSGRITNVTIRNSNSKLTEEITKFFNKHCCSQGHIRPKWKKGKIITTPKPGKKPALDAFRPISLT